MNHETSWSSLTTWSSFKRSFHLFFTPLSTSCLHPSPCNLFTPFFLHHPLPPTFFLYLLSHLHILLIFPSFLFLWSCYLLSLVTLTFSFPQTPLTHPYHPLPLFFCKNLLWTRDASSPLLLPLSLLPCLKCACERSSSATVFPELSRSLSPYRQINLWLSLFSSSSLLLLPFTQTEKKYHFTFSLIA